MDRSISVRLFVDIANAGKDGLTLDEIKRNYSLEEKFRSELKDLTYLGRIKQDENIFSNTSKGRQHAKIVDFLRTYLNLSRKR